MYYENEGRLVPLPDFATFFLTLGRQAARQCAPFQRMVIAVAVPTRLFGVAFTGAGIVMQRSVLPVTRSDDRYFEKLRQLAPGTILSFPKTDSTLVLSGVLRGIFERDRGECVAIEVLKGINRGTHYIRRENVRKIVIPDSCGRLIGMRIEYPDRFLSQVLPRGTSPLEFAQASRMECLLISSPSRLEEEAHTPQLYVFAKQRGFSPEDPGRENVDYFTGRLQDILRLRRYLNEREGYRSDLIHWRRHRSGFARLSEPPAFVLFDGASAYLRARDGWTVSHQIILLDRTERLFDDAVADINRRFTLRTRNEVVLVDMPPVPAGLEMVAWEETE